MMGAKRVHHVRTMGGNTKWRALRLESGNFSWGTEVCTRKTRIIDVVYNASNNELVRTKTLVKGAIILIDGTPFHNWYEQFYGKQLGKRRGKDDAGLEKLWLVYSASSTDAARSTRWKPRSRSSSRA